MKSEWVLFRTQHHRSNRIGVLTQKDGLKIIGVKSPRYPDLFIFVYPLSEVVHIEPLPKKLEFKMRLEGKIEC